MALVLLCSLAIGPGSGSSVRLSYHEAFVAQGAREILTSGQWWHPTVGGLPWLEKPPLPFWLVAVLGWGTGVVSEGVARLPSMASAMMLVLGVGLLAAHRYGGKAGLLAGAIQATTAWTVLRGRLAEADMLLACLITWTLLAFDRLRALPGVMSVDRSDHVDPSAWYRWRWVFFLLLSLMSLVKGTGFGAVLVLAVVGNVLLWDRDAATCKRLGFAAGWLVVLLGSVSWPVAMVVKYGWKVVGLWFMHVTERIGPQVGHGPFAGEAWPQYGLNVLGQALPWVPLVLIGGWWSLKRAVGCVDPGHRILVKTDRLLWTWNVVPLLLVSLASARKAQYTIYALVPWSIWSALGLSRLGGWLIGRGWSAQRLKRLAVAGLVSMAVAYGLGFWLAGPWLNHRSAEWAFYETMGRRVPCDEPLVLLYDDWDRDPYSTPFGPIPHDLAIRLFYLNRPACWHFGVDELANPALGKCGKHHPSTSWLTVLGRQRDLPALEQLGSIEILAEGTGMRWDRTYLVARIQPGSGPVQQRSLGSARTVRYDPPLWNLSHTTW
jgi:4-amino-4-deoxy-L-arabinose transferase-like glycosyltransferase